ncbi:MAG: PAS domain S-box protein [Bacteroidota bacterium]
MRDTYLLDKIEEAIIVVEKEGIENAVNWLAINSFAEKELGCKQEDFITGAFSEMHREISSTSTSGKGSMRIWGKPILQEKTYHFSYYEDSYRDIPCFIFIGTLECVNSVQQPFHDRFLDKAVREVLSDAIIGLDLNLKIFSWNDAASRLYGLSQEVTLGKVISDVIRTDSFEPKEKGDPLTLLQHQYHWKGIMNQKDASGNLLVVSSIMKKISSEDGSDLGYVVVNSDITEQKAMEDALRMSEERLRYAGEIAYDLLYEWIPETGELNWFGDIDKILGFEKGTISRDINAWLALIHPEDNPKMETAVMHHMNSIEPIEYDYRIRNAKGEYRTWWDHGLPILDENQKPVKWVGICTDITNRITSQKELENRDQLLTIIGENFPKAYMSVIFPDFKIGYTNGREFKVNGIDPNQFVGMDTRDVFSPYGEVILNTIVDRYTKTFQGEPQVFELKVGEEIQQYTTQPILNDQGEVNSMLAVVRNITEERQRELKLKESEQKFSKAFRGHPVAMQIVNVVSGELIEINDSFVELTGFTENELFQFGMVELGICEDDSCHREIFGSIQENGDLHDYPFEIKNKDGDRRHLLVSGTLLDIVKGELAIISLVDITERKLVEESLRTSESRLRTLVETLPDLIWLKDPDGKYLACNNRFSQLYNTSEEELIGKVDKDFVSEEIANFFRKNDLRAMQAGSPQKNEEVLTFQSDGHAEHVETIKAPIYNQNGDIEGVLGIARDITERINQLRMLERQNNLLKNIAWMQSHEVRAPLTNIMGLISLMELDTPPSPEEQNFIFKEILKAAHRLDDIIRKIIMETEKYEDVAEEVVRIAQKQNTLIAEE